MVLRYKENMESMKEMYDVEMILMPAHTDPHMAKLDMAFLLDNMFVYANRRIQYADQVEDDISFLRRFHLEKVDYSRINLQLYLTMLKVLLRACIQVSYAKGLYKGQMFIEDIDRTEITFSLYEQ